MRYYLIRDNEDNILAIHKTPDSAGVCFKRFTKAEDSPRFIYLQEVESNDTGIIIRTDTLATYSTRSCVIVFPEDDNGATSTRLPASD